MNSTFRLPFFISLDHNFFTQVLLGSRARQRNVG